MNVGLAGNESHDSASAPPNGEPPLRAPPASAAFRPAQDSHADLPVDEDVVAIAIQTTWLRADVVAALAGRDLALAGPDVIPQATLIVTEAGADIGVQLADLRRRARPDTAILVVLSAASDELVARAHEGGAFACLRPPLVREELLGLIAAAQDSRAARVQAADLARKLDLESHLASIGRITAGLSHEVSSPLGAAALNMEMVQSESARLIEALKWLAYAPIDDVVRRMAIAREHIGVFESQDGFAGAIADTVTAHEQLKSLFGSMRELVGRSHEVRREPVDLLEVVHEVRNKTSLVDHLKRVEVEVIGEPSMAFTDRALLAQMLHHLISNAAVAAKTLPAPRIRVHVYRTGPRAIVSVRDNGPGIPPDLHDRIFEPFFTTRRGKGGTGLGLALCREYALQVRAELSVWSVLGRGACFRVNMPRAT